MTDEWKLEVCPECGERPLTGAGWRPTAGGSWLHEHPEFSPTAWIGAEEITVVRQSSGDQGLRKAASDFLDASQSIERSGDAGEMEEYEECWHQLAAALSDSTDDQQEHKKNDERRVK